MTSKQILAGLEGNEETVKEFLKDESGAWAGITNGYGPATKEGNH
jgi:hypothetical protein